MLRLGFNIYPVFLHPPSPQIPNEFTYNVGWVSPGHSFLGVLLYDG